MIKLIFTISLLFSFSYSINLTTKEKEFLKQNPNIILGADKHWTPYITENFDGSIDGFSKDILDKINSITGANFSIVINDCNQISKVAQEKKIDGLVTSTAQKERETYFNFSEPYLSQDIHLLVKHGNPLRIHTVDDLKGKTIVLEKEAIFNQKLSKIFVNSTIVYKKNTKEKLNSIIYGNADAIIGIGSNDFLNNKNGLPYLTKAFKFKKKLDVVFTVRKDWPEAISILNKGLAKISEKEINILKKKWFDSFVLTNELINLTNKEISYIGSKNIVKICADPSWVAFNYLPNNNQLLSTALIQRVLDKVNLDIELVHTRTWAESLDYIREKKCDLISYIKNTKERQKYIKFTKPITTYPLMLITHKDSIYLSNLNELENKKIAILKKHAGVEMLKEKYPNIELIYVDNGREGLDKVRTKEVYGFVDVLASFRSIFSQIDDVKINRQLEMHISLSLGIRNDDQNLFNIITKSLNSIDEKEKKEILSNLNKLNDDQNSHYKIPWELLVLSLIVIFMILYWNIQLKKAIKKELLKNKKQESLLFFYSKKDAMKDLVGNISHQWKQPVNELSSVLLFVETKLHLNQNLTPKEIKRNIRRARKIINYLSETVSVFKNFYTDRESINNEYIFTLIKHALYIIEGSLRENKIEIKINIKNKKLEVKGVALQQVMLSIFSNIKNVVIEREIKNPLINIRLYDNKDDIILEIEDNCGGIENNNSDIFELGESFTKGGAGLGLYISKRIVEDKYQGQIFAKNTEKGALFTIQIPKIKD